MVKKAMRVSYGVCLKFLIPRSGFLVPADDADCKYSDGPFCQQRLQVRSAFASQET